MRKLMFVMPMLLMPYPGVANASDWAVDAHVTRVEASYVPDKVTLQIDTNVGSCPAGTWIQCVARGTDIQAKAANTQAVLAAAMTALAAGKRLTLVGNNAGCSLDFVHLIP